MSCATSSGWETIATWLDAHHVLQRARGQGLLRGVHDPRPDRVDVGREVLDEVVFRQPGESLGIDVQVRERRGRGAEGGQVLMKASRSVLKVSL
jgi:hypothetical protein